MSTGEHASRLHGGGSVRIDVAQALFRVSRSCRRDARAPVIVFLLEVRALDAVAKAFYLKHELIEMLDANSRLYLSLKKIRKLLTYG